MRSGAIVIAGATGVVGARALDHLLARRDVARVVAVGRRAVPVRHARLESRVVDLGDASAVAAAVPAGAAVAISCLGTTLKKAGSRAAFRAVDRDAVVTFAAAAVAAGARRFVLVSAVGAAPSSRSFYLRTKGEAEAALERLGYDQLTVLRPSLIDDEGARRESRPAERLSLPLARLLFASFGRTGRYAPITADALARSLVHHALDATDAPVRVVEGEALHAAARR